VDFVFKNRKLETLYTLEQGAEAYPQAVVAAFFEVMTVIENAPFMLSKVFISSSYKASMQDNTVYGSIVNGVYWCNSSAIQRANTSLF
jgi:hypothetical protein